VRPLRGQELNPDIIDAVAQQQRLSSTTQQQQQQQRDDNTAAAAAAVTAALAADGYFAALMDGSSSGSSSGSNAQREVPGISSILYDLTAAVLSSGLSTAAAATARDSEATQTPGKKGKKRLKAELAAAPAAAAAVAAGVDLQQQQQQQGHDQQQQQQQLQVLLVGCVLQRLQVLQQRLLRVQYWCPAGLSITAARKLAHKEKGGKTPAAAQGTPIPAAAAAVDDGEDSGSDSETAAGGEADGEQQQQQLEEEEQRQQRLQHLQHLHDVWLAEGQQLVGLLLQPVMQQQQQQQQRSVATEAAAEHYSRLSAHVETWAPFAGSDQLTAFIGAGLQAYLQQQQQPSSSSSSTQLMALCAAQQLGLPPHPHCDTAAAAAAAAERGGPGADGVLPGWLFAAGAQQSCVAAFSACLQDSLAGLSSTLSTAAAAAGGSMLAAAERHTSPDSTSSSKRKKKHKVKHAELAVAPSPAAAAAAGGGSNGGCSAAQQLAALAALFSNSSNSAAAVVCLFRGLSEAPHWGSLGPLLLSWQGLSTKTPAPESKLDQGLGSPAAAEPYGGSSHASQPSGLIHGMYLQQQQQEEEGKAMAADSGAWMGLLLQQLQQLCVWLSAVGQLPLRGLQQQQAVLLVGQVMAAAAAAAQVAHALWGQAGPAAAAAVGSMLAQHYGQICQQLSEIFTAVLRVLARFDSAGCGQWARVLRPEASCNTPHVQQQQQVSKRSQGAEGSAAASGLGSEWQGVVVVVLTACCLMVPAAAAAEGGRETPDAALAAVMPTAYQLLTSQLHSAATATAADSAAASAGAAGVMSHLALQQLSLTATALGSSQGLGKAVKTRLKGKTLLEGSAAAAAAAAQAVCVAALLCAPLVGTATTTAAAGAASTAAATAAGSSDGSGLHALQLLQLLTAPRAAAAAANGGAGGGSACLAASSAAAAAAVLYRGLSCNAGLLKQLAAGGAAGSYTLQQAAGDAVDLLLRLKQQQQHQQQQGGLSWACQEQQLLYVVSFINAAHLTLTKTASSTAVPADAAAGSAGAEKGGGGGGVGSSTFAAVLHNSMQLLRVLSPSVTCWPGVPPGYVTMDDVIATAAAAASVTRVTPSSSSSSSAKQQQQQQQSQGQHRLLVSAVLMGLRDVVSVAPRQLQLQLHQFLCNPAALLLDSTGTAAAAAAGAHSDSPQQQQQQVLPWLQLLLVVLESAHGPKSLKLLSSHTATYCSTLLHNLTRTQLLPLLPGALSHLPLLTAAAAAAAAGGGGAIQPVSLQQQQQQQQGFSRVSWAMRCLESMVGRETSFALPATTTAAVLAAAADIAQQLLQLMTHSAEAPAASILAHGCDGGNGCCKHSAGAAAVFCSACSLLVAVVRHRGADLQRQMHLMTAAAQQLLLLLVTTDRHLRDRLAAQTAASMQFGREQPAAAGRAAEPMGSLQQQQMSDEAALLVRCGGQLGRLYEALAEQGQQLGRQCHYIVTDYVMHMASAAPVSLSMLLSTAAAAAGGLDAGLCSGITTAASMLSGTALTTTLPAAAAGSASLSPAAVAAVSVEVSGPVRRGACLLFGVLDPSGVQAVYQVISQGSLGGVRREVLLGLRGEFEAQHKHSGKV